MLTKKQVDTDFLDRILPKILKGDKPAIRQAWNEYVDMLHKDGEITTKQADTWVCPIKRAR